MKTQIANLINGRRRTFRMLNHPKYDAARHDANYETLGTSYKERFAIAEKVAAENPNDLSITVKGVSMTAEKYTSTSGKSWAWTAEISREMYEGFGGQSNRKDDGERYFLRIAMDCTVDGYKSKSHGKGSSKVNGYIDIDEAFVTIN